jgi:hypothetical protein
VRNLGGGSVIAWLLVALGVELLSRLARAAARWTSPRGAGSAQPAGQPLDPWGRIWRPLVTGGRLERPRPAVVPLSGPAAAGEGELEPPFSGTGAVADAAAPGGWAEIAGDELVVATGGEPLELEIMALEEGALPGERGTAPSGAGAAVHALTGHGGGQVSAGGAVALAEILGPPRALRGRRATEPRCRWATGRGRARI